MPDSITLEELWIKCRGVENAFRYYGDLIAAVGKDLQDKGGLKYGVVVPDPKLRAGMDLAFPVAEEEPTLPPHRCPPWCRTEPFAVVAGLKDLAKIADAVIRVTQSLMAERVKVQAGEQPFEAYVSEHPGTCWPYEKEHPHE